VSAITVIGNVVTSPERKRTQNGSVTKFRVAETKRRFDSARQEWINASTFFVDVECWGHRRLGVRPGPPQPAAGEGPHGGAQPGLGNR
jgi:single-stranded DNA-binding protein